MSPRCSRTFVQCPACGENFTPAPPKGARKVTRYLPDDARFASWINARGGSASLHAIRRRFNLSADERDVLLGRFTAPRDGIVLHHHGRGGGFRFTLLRMPRSLRASAA